MAKVASQHPPEVIAVLAGKSPFLHYSHPSDVFRDVFDTADRFARKEDDEKADAALRRQSSSVRFTTSLKRTATIPEPHNGIWKWDKKLGLLFIPTTPEYADARNGSSKLVHDKDGVLKVAGKLGYKPHRTTNDKVLEGFAKLLKVKEERSEIVVEESRKVELRDIKRGAIHLNKFTLHNKIPEQFLRYYDEFHCARGVQSFMKHEVYDEFLLSLIHYFYFHLLGLTQKFFRLTLKKGKLVRLPGQLELPILKERNRMRRVFRYEIQNARMEVAKKYITLLSYVLKFKQPSPGSFAYKPHPIVPERFFFESLLNVACLAVCVAFLQRSNRLIRAEFGQLFRREAFNEDSLERTIEAADYETYSDRALRVFEKSRKSIMEREFTEKLMPRSSPKDRRLKLSDVLAKPYTVNWNSRVKGHPKVWELKAKKPFYIVKPSILDATDYASQKYRVSVELRKNSPLIELLFGQENLELREQLLHAVPEIHTNALLAKLRPARNPVDRIPYRWLTPYHVTLGIIGKRLRLFDYWTLLPAMNNDKKLTLPGLTREARYRAFKTMRLLFPQGKRRSRKPEPSRNRAKETATSQARKSW